MKWNLDRIGRGMKRRSWFRFFGTGNDDQKTENKNQDVKKINPAV
jgi:hypothetical protein